LEIKMDCIIGQIGQVRYQATSLSSEAGNRFVIAQFTQEDNNKYENISIKGEMNSPVFGWRYKLYGQFDPPHPKYGKTFSFESFEPILHKSNEGMADYLSRSVPQIGKVYARKIVDHFGENSFTILKTDPSRLREVPGLSRIARDQAEGFFSEDNSLEIDPTAYARLFDLLSPIRPPRKVIKSLLLNFGSNAPQFITNNPYRLLDYPGMGWIRVDRFAVDVLGYDPNGLERHKKALLEVLAKEAEHGHTKSDQPTLHVEASKLLKTTLVPDAINSLRDEGTIIIEDDYISSYKLYESEKIIARELNRIQSNIIYNSINKRRIDALKQMANRGGTDNEKEIAGIALDNYISECSYLDFDISEEEFDEEQKQIPAIVKANAVSIITGVPGSGKSYSVGIIVKSLYQNGIRDILIVAPTGKAAKRNDEFIQESLPGIRIPCMTIHRALAAQISDEAEEGVPQEEARINRGRERFSFEYGKDKKLPYQYFIMDEASMTDVSLAANFLEAIPDGARLLIVGDKYQLPSVGPGSFLRDLLAAGIPSVVLDKPRRNSGAIAQACYEIKEGRCPIPSKEPSNWTHVERQTEDQILDVIREIHVRYIAQNGIEAAKANLQVISPEKKKVLGCNNLNRMLASIMNPGEGPLPELKGEESEATPRLHDKVVRTKNAFVKELTKNSPIINDDDYYENSNVKSIIFEGEEYYIGECAIVNGDQGEVMGFKGSDVIVKFSNPDRLCLLPKSESHISLAYAQTFHKCQGSGFPIVIMVLWDFYWNPKLNVGLYCRELVYTGKSRAINRGITVGLLSSLRKAISRVTIHQRKTRLSNFIERIQNEDLQELRCTGDETNAIS
jgi:exodeoxyribonuclease V alpha subunit